MRIRPTFEILVPLRKEQVFARIRASLEDSASPCHGYTSGRHAEIFVDEGVRRFWSPWLSLHIEESGQTTRIRGRFSPYPSIWTFYVFLYFLFGCTLGSGAIFGYAQGIVGDTPWGYWAVPLCAVGLVGTFLASFVGQRLAASQMSGLRSVVDRALGDEAREAGARDVARQVSTV